MSRQRLTAMLACAVLAATYAAPAQADFTVAYQFGSAGSGPG